jgi:UDP-glucuronate 4-epimerase
MPQAVDSGACVVTGAAGFIGSHLCAALVSRGRRVIGIDNFDAFYDRAAKRSNIERVKRAAGDDSGLFEIVEHDIRSASQIQAVFARVRPGAVFHLAALAGVRPSIAAPARYVSVNLDGLVNVLEATRGAGCHCIVFASSSSVYGNNATVPFAEDDAVDHPISPYAATKRAGELMCQTYARLYGMRIGALRFFTVYGPAQRPDLAISKFMRLIAAGQEVPMYGDGSTSRDYTYIDDILEGILAAHEKVSDSSEGFFRIWNLGSDHPITLADMVDTIAAVVGRPARIKRFPMQVGDVERTWANLRRSASELGFGPHTAFVAGLQKQWAWLNNQSEALTA